MRLRRRMRLRHHRRVLSASTFLVALAIDARAATEQYLASVPPDVRARSDAYFEGGYWIRLWSTLLTIGIMWLLLHTGLSRRMRGAAERITPCRLRSTG
jgi:STE24 endopeptidase